MRIVGNNIAVLDYPDQLSAWVESSGRLCQDDGVAFHYLPHIKPGDVVIDAGAAIGDHTIAYLERVGENGWVHAFEANPLMFECLRHNITHPNATLYQVALSSAKQMAWLGYEKINVGAGFVSSADAGCEMVVGVQASDLDSLRLPRVDFIKMDIEGSEFDAITGARETISRCKPKMIIEVCHHQLSRLGHSSAEFEELIKSIGYTITPIMGDRGELRYEALCIPE